jgi:prolyl 4-hydroxylase
MWTLFKPKAPKPVLTRLSFKPSIWQYPGFLTEAECRHIIDLATPTMQRATVLDPDTGERITHSARTSTVTFLPFQGDAVVSGIEQRLAQWLEMPLENGEDLQVLHYGPGEEYIPHYDFFNPKTPGRSRELARGGQRYITVLLYLNDVESGGETIFPHIHLSIPPQKGMALVFFNTDADGEVDWQTWHGSSPVIRGEKWVATKWIRQHTFPR